MKKLVVLPLVLMSTLLWAQGNKKFCEQVARLGDIASNDSLTSLQGKMITENDTEFESTYQLAGAVSAKISLDEFGNNATAIFLMKKYGTDSAKAVNEFEKMAQQVKDCLPVVKIENVMKQPGKPQTKRFFYYKKAMIVVETYKIYRTGQWVSEITAYRR